MSFESLFALNCSEELTCAADVVWPEHCTSFAVVAGGRAVSGHNEDWYPEEIEGQTIRIVRLTERRGSAAYISAGPAYNLPITGVTAAGFSSAANTVYYRDERVGVPNNFLLAAVLGQPDLEHARDLIVHAPRARGSNHLLCDASGRVWDIETSGYAMGAAGRLAGAGRRGTRRRHGALRARQPLPVAGACARRRVDIRGLTPAADPRGRAPHRGRAGRRRIVVELSKSLLCDHENAPFSICDHWEDDDPDPDQSVTTASMVWEPAEARRAHRLWAAVRCRLFPIRTIGILGFVYGFTSTPSCGSVACA